MIETISKKKKKHNQKTGAIGIEEILKISQK
jgi:hypothetical protein